MPLVPGHAKNRVAVHDGTGSAVVRQPGRPPDYVARFQVITAHRIAGGSDDLRRSLSFDDGRCGPGIALVAILLPDRLPTGGFQALDGGLAGVIANENEFSLVHYRRTSLTKTGADFRFSQVALPELLSIERVGKQSRRAEPAVDALAIAEGRSRSKTGILVMAFVGDHGGRHLAPELLARLPVEAEHDHLVAGVGKLDPEDPLGLVLGFREGRIDLAGVDGGGYEHLVSENDGATGAIPFDLGLPSGGCSTRSTRTVESRSGKRHCSRGRATGASLRPLTWRGQVGSREWKGRKEEEWLGAS